MGDVKEKKMCVVCWKRLIIIWIDIRFNCLDLFIWSVVKVICYEWSRFNSVIYVYYFRILIIVFSIFFFFFKKNEVKDFLYMVIIFLNICKNGIVFKRKI